MDLSLQPACLPAGAHASQPPNTRTHTPRIMPPQIAYLNRNETLFLNAMSAYIQVLTTKGTHTYTHINIHIYIYIHTYIYILSLACTHTRPCTHTYTHTHTYTLSLACTLACSLACRLHPGTTDTHTPSPSLSLSLAHTPVYLPARVLACLPNPVTSPPPSTHQLHTTGRAHSLGCGVRLAQALAQGGAGAEPCH